jgi:hypothetical protein
VASGAARGRYWDGRRTGIVLLGLLRPSSHMKRLSGHTFHVRYDDADPNRLIEELVNPGLAEQGPQDGLMGAGFVEQILTDLLA